MPNNEAYTPYIHVEISADLKTRLSKNLRYGQLRHLTEALLTQVMDAIDRVGVNSAPVIVGAIISGRISIVDILRSQDDGK